MLELACFNWVTPTELSCEAYKYRGEVYKYYIFITELKIVLFDRYITSSSRGAILGNDVVWKGTIIGSKIEGGFQ